LGKGGIYKKVGRTMRIALVNPPFVKLYSRSSRWAARSRGGTLYYPIWLSYAAGLLEKHGYKISLVDAPAWGWDGADLKAHLDMFRPDVVVTESNFQSLSNDIEMAKRANEGSHLVIVGPPASQFAEKILKEGINFVIRYEYDLALLELVEALERGSSLTGVRNLSFLKERIIDNPVRFSSSEEIEGLAFVSEVYKTHLDVRNYFLNHSRYPMVQIMTGRGCPNRCTFCSWPETLMGRKYRTRSIENVVDEFQFVRDEMPEIREIFIEDDTFTLNKDRTQRFCQELKDREIDIKWGCQCRADIDYSTMRAMKQAGCRLLDVGYESGNDEMLNRMRKGLTKSDLERFTNEARRAGMRILSDFVIGLPGETKQTIDETMLFIEKIRPDLLQVAVATPIPGTEFFDYCKSNAHLMTEDLEDSLNSEGFQKCIVRYPHLSNEEIEENASKIMRRYYLSLSYLPIALDNLIDQEGVWDSRTLIRSILLFIRSLGSKDS
jgi:anaerobic magnesium-protoporphyrin IX monomethyl ester cyclase